MTEPMDPGYDPQRAVFAEAGESDWAAAAALMDDAVVHEPGDPDAPPIRTPEEWDAEQWDSERQPPKTAEEATAALAARVAVADAPDIAGFDYASGPMTPEQRGEDR